MTAPDRDGPDSEQLLEAASNELVRTECGHRAAEIPGAVSGAGPGAGPGAPDPAQDAEHSSSNSTQLGSNFVSTYPPFSVWNTGQVDACRERLSAPIEVGGLERPGTGLYVHVPFCLERCTYCYYMSKARPDRALVERYTRALLTELEHYAHTPALQGRTLDFVYVGGGTPSMLEPDQIRRLLEGIDELFPPAPNRELCFECAPRTALPARLQALRASGVTRVSMGVQALDDGVLRRNGRVHGVDEVLRAYSALRDVGFDVVNLDLMVGLLGETGASFSQGLEHMIDLAPDSLTLYQLEVPRNTPLCRAIERGQLSDQLVSWEVKHDRLAQAFSRLESAGYHQRSAYAAVRDPERHRFVYQDAQIAGADLIGVGASAFAYLGGVHHQNESSIERYLAQVEAGELPIRRAHLLTDQERLVREFILQLKLGHVSRSRFRERHGVDLLEVFAAPLEHAAEQGWLLYDRDDDLLRVTRTGLPRVDRLTPSFYLEQHRGVRYS